MKVRPWFAWVAGLLLTSACADVSVTPGSSQGPLIYGADDRREWYETTDTALRGLALSTAGLFQSTQVTLRTDGRYQISTSSTLATSQRVCASEPYRSQPTPAFCSGFLAAPDLFVTAGHCITSDRACRSTTIAFGFRMEGATTVRSIVDAQDVYRCAAIVGRVETTTDDWAVVRLDRAVTGRTPLPVRRAGAVSVGDPLLVIGHPSGLPQKIAGGATVRANGHAYYFEANLDTYGGNSGSPVFNVNTGEVEGVLVRGNPDYVYNSSGGCYVSNVCPDTGCPGAGWEDVTRAARFASLIPTPQDCSANGACNAACAAGTDPDCPTPACGNGVCDAGESCDGRNGTLACADCPGRTGGPSSRRYCYVSGACQGAGCP